MVLLLLSVEDCLEGQLSMHLIFLLGMTGVIAAVTGGRSVSPWLGVLLLFVGRCTDERIGYGDGWLMLALGMWFPFGMLWKVFLKGLVLAVAWGSCRKKREVPLVPFLTAAYVMGELI